MVRCLAVGHRVSGKFDKNVVSNRLRQRTLFHRVLCTGCPMNWHRAPCTLQWGFTKSCIHSHPPPLPTHSVSSDSVTWSCHGATTSSQSHSRTHTRAHTHARTGYKSTAPLAPQSRRFSRSRAQRPGKCGTCVTSWCTLHWRCVLCAAVCVCVCAVCVGEELH